MRPTGSGTILEVGEDVDYSGRGSSGGVSVPDLGMCFKFDFEI